MVNTNALLSIAFTLISNFTNVVQVPDWAAPKRVEDLERYVIGNPMRDPLLATDVYIVHKRGSSFWIHYGVVRGFRMPGSFFEAQNPELLPKFTGAPVMSSNDVVAMATGIIKRLAKGTNQLQQIVPVVQYGGQYRGTEIPFYRISWPVTNSTYGPAAEIEIDARKREIESVWLSAPWFRDAAKAQEIIDEVYSPDPIPPPKLKPTGKRIVPYPTTNQVTQGIHNWLALCQRLGLDAGNETNISDINWERSVVYTNKMLSPRADVIQVRFKNGACFEAIDGVVFDHFSADACFTGFWDTRPSAEWKQFEGKVTVDWQARAREFMHFVSNSLGVPLTTLESLRQWPVNKAADPGIEGLARMVVRWYDWPTNKLVTDLLDVPIEMACEFDLRDGKVKWFEINPKLIGWREKR